MYAFNFPLKFSGLIATFVAGLFLTPTLSFAQPDLRSILTVYDNIENTSISLAVQGVPKSGASCKQSDAFSWSPSCAVTGDSNQNRVSCVLPLPPKTQVCYDIELMAPLSVNTSSVSIDSSCPILTDKQVIKSNDTQTIALVFSAEFNPTGQSTEQFSIGWNPNTGGINVSCPSQSP